MSQASSLSDDLPQSPSSTATRPRVLIVGAGLGGLTLGLLLQKAGIPYEIFERSPAIKPLGSALSLGDNVAALFRQLGIYEELVEAGLVNNTMIIRDENAKLDYTVDFSPRAVLGGSALHIISRPAIYGILYRRIPHGKIHFNKRVLTFKTAETGVQLSCSDGSVYEGDILVGADGTNSAVRQGFYRQLKEDGLLPKSDDTPLPYTCIRLVGQTPPLDLEKFPELRKEECVSNSMCGVGNPFTWITFTTKYRTICWMVAQHLDEVTLKNHDTFKSSEWGPEAAGAMVKEVRDFPIPNGPPGSTLGTLIDLTPKELVSKVTLEEKVFQTWYSGRAVLLGDACHKLHPAGGVGAAMALQDAICLANWINVLPSTDIAATEQILQEYYSERYPIALQAYEKSRVFASVNKKTIRGAIARFIRRNMPHWLWLIILKKTSVHRPQVSFLPLADDKGTVPPAPQSKPWRY